jgi:exonuclease SbcD
MEFSVRNATVQRIDVPVFQKLERIRGSWEQIEAAILALSEVGSNAWLEIIYDGDELIGDLRERLDAAIVGSGIQILRVKNTRIINRILEGIHDKETLDDLNVEDVFERCLVLHEVPEEQRAELLHAYQETITSLNDEDPLSE